MPARPDNPYQVGTVLWAVMEGGLQEVYDGLPGWSDLSNQQIAEVLGAEIVTVRKAFFSIYAKSGFRVPYARDSRGRKRQ